MSENKLVRKNAVTWPTMGVAPSRLWAPDRNVTRSEVDQIVLTGMVPLLRELVETCKFLHSLCGKSLEPTTLVNGRNVIVRQIEALSIPPPPRSSVDVMHSSFVLTQSTLLGKEGGSRNRLL